MTPEFVAATFQQAFMTAFWLAAPLLLIGFGVGVVINLIQIATSMQDPSFNTIPRLGAFFGGFLLLLPWMLKKISAYAIAVLGDLGRYAQ